MVRRDFQVTAVVSSGFRGECVVAEVLHPDAESGRPYEYGTGAKDLAERSAIVTLVRPVRICGRKELTISEWEGSRSHRPGLPRVLDVAVSGCEGGLIFELEVEVQ